MGCGNSEVEKSHLAEQRGEDPATKGLWLPWQELLSSSASVGPVFLKVHDFLGLWEHGSVGKSTCHESMKT